MESLWGSSDILCPMYPPISSMADWAADPYPEDRPLILCEYSHAMGNSNGSLADYWAAFTSLPGVQGGCVWEWADHSLATTTADGRVRWAYGGDFGEPRHDANFCADGLISADRVPHPALQELAWCHRPVRVLQDGQGRIIVENTRHFIDISDLDGAWRLTCDGLVVAAGAMPATSLAPGAAAAVALPLPELPPHGEAWLTITWTTKGASAWAPAGWVVAWDQVAVRAAPPAPPVRTAPGTATGAGWTLHHGDSSLVVDHDGLPGTWRHRGRSLLASPPRPHLWRAHTDNDGVKLWSGQETKALGRWRALGLDRTVLRSVSCAGLVNGPGGTVVRSHHQIWGQPAAGAAVLIAYYHLDLGLGQDGGICLVHRFVPAPGITDLPRIGVALALPAGWEQVTWFGLGPHENYPDRRSAAVVDIHRCRVADLQVPYVMPQENGGRGGVRWWEMDNGQQILRCAGGHAPPGQGQPSDHR
jgi:beta-galactosidase